MGVDAAVRFSGAAVRDLGRQPLSTWGSVSSVRAPTRLRAAASEAFVAFGCTDGVLILEPHDDHWDARTIERPEGSADDARTGTLAAAGGTLVGNLGSGALAVIDIEGGVATAVELPVDMRGFALAPDGASVVVLTIDGQVHLIDPVTGTITTSTPVVDAFELPEGHGAAPIPQLAVVEGHIFVTDPVNGGIVELDSSLAELGRFDVGGAPAGVVLAG